MEPGTITGLGPSHPQAVAHAVALFHRIASVADVPSTVLSYAAISQKKMNNHVTSKKLKAVLVQIIEIDQGVILKRGGIEISVRGNGAVEVVPTLFEALAQESHTSDELCELFPFQARYHVRTLIETLVAQHILIGESEAPDYKMEPRESEVNIFYGQFWPSVHEVRKRLSAQAVAVLGVNHISRQLIRSFEASGIDNFHVVDYPLLRNLRFFDDRANLIDGQWPSAKSPLEYTKWRVELEKDPSICIIATSDFSSHQTLRQWNRFCVERDIPFMPVVLKDMIGYVGPLVIPGETACYECFWGRLNSHETNLRDRDAIDRLAFEGQIVNGLHPSMASALGDLAAIEFTKFYGGQLPSTKVGAIIEVDLMNTRLLARKVLKIPRCGVCSALNKCSPVGILKPHMPSDL